MKSPKPLPCDSNENFIFPTPRCQPLFLLPSSSTTLTCFTQHLQYYTSNSQWLVFTVKGKGMSSSATPYSRHAPSWLKLTPYFVVEQIIKYARKGLTPSQIGVLLRDSHGVTQVKVVTGNKILRILKSNGKLFFVVV